MLFSSSSIPYMTTSSNGNIFRVTGPLCGEFTGHRWIPRTQRPVTRSFDVFFDLRQNKRLSKQSWLRRHRAHYDVTVMRFVRSSTVQFPARARGGRHCPQQFASWSPAILWVRLSVKSVITLGDSISTTQFVAGPAANQLTAIMTPSGIHHER